MEKKMEHVILKYDQGIRKDEVNRFDIPAHEFEAMIEYDYQERLRQASRGEVIKRRTPQEIFDEMNREERNSWQTLNRHQHQFSVKSALENEGGVECHTMDRFSDTSQIEMLESWADYEAICQLIRHSSLTSKQADLIIAICLDGMRVNDYAKKLNENPKNISKRYVRAKTHLKKKYSEIRNEEK